MKPIILMSAIVLATATPLLAADKTYDFEGFSKVIVRGGIDVSVRSGDDYALAVTVSRRALLRHLRVRQEGETLIVERRGHGSFFLMGLADRYEVTMSLPDLAAVTAEAGAEVEVAGTITAAMAAAASSGADLDLAGLAAPSVSLTASSGASLRAQGTCGVLTARVSSGAKIEAEELVCARATLGASSGGDLDAYATEAAQATATSSADIRLFGNALLRDFDESSGGDIRPAG